MPTDLQAEQTVARLRESGVKVELKDGELAVDLPRWMGEEIRQVFRYQVVLHYDAILRVLEAERDDS